MSQQLLQRGAFSLTQEGAGVCREEKVANSSVSTDLQHLIFLSSSTTANQLFLFSREHLQGPLQKTCTLQLRFCRIKLISCFRKPDELCGLASAFTVFDVPQKYPFFSQLLTHDQSEDYSNSISVVLFWQGGFAINFLLLFLSLSSSIYFRPLMTSSVKTCLCRHEQQLLKASVFFFCCGLDFQLFSLHSCACSFYIFLLF